MQSQHRLSELWRAMRERWAGDGAAALIPRTRGGRWVAAAVGVLLVAGGAAVVVVVDRYADPAPTADGSARDGGPSSTTGGFSPTTGPGLTATGIHLDVATNSVGEMAVTEQLVLGAPITELAVSPPPSVDGAERRPRLEDVQVSVDGVRVAGIGEVTEGTTFLTLRKPTTQLELRYRVVDAVARSEPASPGRATLSLRPAAAAALGTAPTVVALHGSVVHTLVCADMAVDRQLCGVDETAGWRTEGLTADGSHVLALVDLPEPGAETLG